METLVDDVGSFPLPSRMSRQAYAKAYVKARKLIAEGKNIVTDESLRETFVTPMVDSFKKKIASGLDVTTYPQHFDMYEQFTAVIGKAMESGSYLVSEKDAVIPEVVVIEKESKRLCREIGERIRLRVCITGPLELYLRMVGTTLYEDVLLMFAETVRRFARNSLINSKYLKTDVLSIDEPSLGFRDISGNWQTVLSGLEKAFDFAGVVRQIHLHSAGRITDLLGVRNVDVLSFEFGGSPKNIESVTKQALDRADKGLRVGIARTDWDAIAAERRDSGGPKRFEMESMVESRAAIRKRYEIAKLKYGERLVYAGPDCGLGGWPTQQTACLLLRRTVEAVKSCE